MRTRSSSLPGRDRASSPPWRDPKSVGGPGCPGARQPSTQLSPTTEAEALALPAAYAGYKVQVGESLDARLESELSELDIGSSASTYATSFSEARKNAKGVRRTVGRLDTLLQPSRWRVNRCQELGSSMAGRSDETLHR